MSSQISSWSVSGQPAKTPRHPDPSNEVGPESAEKAVAEAKQGKRAIMLIGLSSYFMVGQEKTQRWIST